MIMFTGHDRTYNAPAHARNAAAVVAAAGDDPLAKRVMLGQTTAWDLFTVMRRPDLSCTGWADKTLDALLASSGRKLPCTDCEDSGWYALVGQDPDLLTHLLRREGEGVQVLTAAGTWEQFKGTGRARVIDPGIAEDLADAVQSGASGLLLRYVMPRAWLPPDSVITAGAVPIIAADSPNDTGDDEEGWTPFAVVDELDPGAVLDLIRLRPGPKVQLYDPNNGGWNNDAAMLASLQSVKPPPLVELSAEQLPDILAQIDESAAEFADKVDKAKEKADATTAAVSPDPRAEKLRRYWSIGGKGGAKIRWGTSGDWKRCFRYLSKYMGARAKGYCQNMHKRNTGIYTGSRLNASGAVPPISALISSLQIGAWVPENEGVDAMTSGIRDGVYAERLDDAVLIRALTAGGFPVKPPDDWFGDPGLPGPTPLTVDDDGRVHGHIATFDVTHIGLPGRVHAPKSRTNYAYFKTGLVRTAGGKDVSVGQLTLAGGHAPLSADASRAVAHYDNTASAVADVNVGEDRHGIWVAGALRPDIRPEQIRVLRASAPSGDWRPINGNLELVAVCQVNVPGFPVARARVASGAITAMVAAGARPLAVIKASAIADAAVEERIAALEQSLAQMTGADEPDMIEFNDGVTDDVPVISLAVEELPEVPEPLLTTNDAVLRARQRVQASVERREAERVARRAEIRARVHGTDPEEELAVEEMITAAITAAAAGKKPKGSMPDGSFPIATVSDLKKAVQAFGRAKASHKAAVKRHIISRARALKHTELIPDNWKPVSAAGVVTAAAADAATFPE
jgi:hypothetical protein